MAMIRVGDLCLTRGEYRDILTSDPNMTEAEIDAAVDAAFFQAEEFERTEDERALRLLDEAAKKAAEQLDAWEVKPLTIEHFEKVQDATRDYLEQPQQAPTYFFPLRLFTFSLVDYCDVCFSKDFDTPKQMEDGRICKHPCRVIERFSLSPVFGEEKKQEPQPDPNEDGVGGFSIDKEIK